jgi:hypothetical protein
MRLEIQFCNYQHQSQVVKIIVLYRLYIYNSRSLQQLGESLLMADHDGQDLVTILTQVGKGTGRDPFFFAVVLDGSRFPFIGQLIQPLGLSLGLSRRKREREQQHLIFI